MRPSTFKKDEPKDSQGSGEPPASGGSSEDKAKTIQPTHNGKLLLDATCPPADVRYPTDLSLLDEPKFIE